MIVKSMSDREIIKELKFIDDILESRSSGYIKKYKKELNSKAYKHNAVLDTRRYEINGNKVLVCFQKLVITDKLSDLKILYIVITEDNGAFSPDIDLCGNYAFFHITKHAVDRMWERMGLTIKDFFVNEYVIKADSAYQLIEYDGYGYDDSTYIIAIGKCFFIACERDNNIVFKTALDSERIHQDQTMLYGDSKRGAEKYADKMDKKVAEFAKRKEFNKTIDIVRAMYA